MAGRRKCKYDWELYDPVAKLMHAEGAPLQAIYATLRALGYDGHYNALGNRLNHTFGLYFRPPLVRPPTLDYFTKRAKRIREGFPADGVPNPKALGLMDFEEGRVTRLCQRPELGPPTSLTAALMGDPRPGRTKWAA